MASSIFDDKLIIPDELKLTEALGAAKLFLDSICLFIDERHGNFKTEWKHYGNKSGWVLKLFSGKRNVLFIIPYAGYFKVAVTLGDKAVDGVILSDLPYIIKDSFVNAPIYSEGRTVHLEVNSEIDLKNILTLVVIKMGG